MTAPLPHILIIEDDVSMTRFLQTLLRSHGYGVTAAAGGAEGLRCLSGRSPDLVLLDLGLGDMDGVALLRELRAWSAMPVIVISAREREAEKVEALDAGADDYLTKPFGAQELLARIRVALRRPGRDAELPLQLGEITVDPAARRVCKEGEPLHLTPTEYKLLLFLLRHAEKVVTHRQILSAVWGPAHVEHHEYVRVHMSQLRQKLEAQPAHPRILLTEPGIGYRLVVP
ncbi:response regulator [Oceanimonas smirnovii]|uniref:response regulator n=1 Tax=Oceanimonas smirnovii TaxID=264574 RepID=UPI000364168B|nr:response regulator [Oceanimonas smirnovii]